MTVLCVGGFARACSVKLANLGDKSSRGPCSPCLFLTSPGLVFGVDFFEPLLLTTRGCAHILLFTVRFTRRADMSAVAAADFTTKGAASIFVNLYITLWGFPSTIMSDNSPQFTSKLFAAIYDLFGVHKVTTTSYRPQTTGGTESVNQMAPMLEDSVNDCLKQLRYCASPHRLRLQQLRYPCYWAWLLAKFSSAAFHAFLSFFLDRPNMSDTRARIKTNRRIATKPSTVSDTLRTLLGSNTLLPCLAWNAVIPSLSGSCITSQFSRLATWSRSTTAPPPFHKERSKTPTTSISKGQVLVVVGGTFLRDPRRGPCSRVRHA